MSSVAPETDLTDSLVTEFKLDPASSSHLYLQVRNGLARMIREHLGISRVTARKAISALVDEGLIQPPTQRRLADLLAILLGQAKTAAPWKSPTPGAAATITTSSPS